VQTVPPLPSEPIQPERHVSRVQVIAVILIATCCVAVGETLLSVGMRQMDKAGVQGLALLGGALKNPYVVGGTLLMMVYFGLYSLCLSWADISYVLPFTALSYLLVALFARFLLHENVTSTRWLGTLLIVAGVVIVGLGERSPKP
jgi:drug/metabolite transporter (DMT)-like permease